MRTMMAPGNSDDTPSAGASCFRRFVTDVLNGHRQDVVDRLFQAGYRDHDPLLVPGFLEDPGFAGGIGGVRALAGLLSAPGVDMAFTPEVVFGDDERIAYRLFGEGVVPLAAVAGSPALPPIGGSALRDGTTGLQRPLGRPDVEVVHVLYSCTGIFQLSGGRFRDRWGHVQLALVPTETRSQILPTC